MKLSSEKHGTLKCSQILGMRTAVGSDAFLCHDRAPFDGCFRNHKCIGVLAALKQFALLNVLLEMRHSEVDPENETVG